MKPCLRLIGFFFAISTSIVVGGNEGGNGGGGVVCRAEDGTETVRLLDYYETSKLAPELRLSLGDAAQTELEKVTLVLNRLMRIDEKRARAYRDKASVFFANVRFVKDVLLPDTNDFGYVPLEKNCRIVQIAVQRPTVFPEYRLYTINEDLYKRLSVEHRAGLILHEIIYKEALTLGHLNSIPSRYYTSLISSSRLENISLLEYGALMKQIGMVPLVNGLPPLWNARSWNMGKRIEGMEFRFPLMDKMKDVQNAQVTLSAHALPKWMKLDSAGYLKGTPSGIGKYEGEVEAFTSLGRRERVHIHGEIVAAPLGPEWVASTISMEGSYENQFFLMDLRGFVVARDAAKLEFSKIAGPNWITVKRDGTMLGTPALVDLGRNLVQVEVRDASGRKSNVSIELRVEKAD